MGLVHGLRMHAWDDSLIDSGPVHTHLPGADSSEIKVAVENKEDDVQKVV